MRTVEEKRTAQRLAGERFRQRHPKSAADHHRFVKFGMTKEQFEEKAAAQGGLCKICHEPEPGHRNGVRKALAVDHDHVTLKFRGLLCSRCNTALGLLKENVGLIEELISYIQKNRD
jgi:hypothetical protein